MADNSLPKPPETPSFSSETSTPITATIIDEPEARAQEPVRGAQILAVVLLVLVADLAIYRGQGFAGYAALFAAVPFLLSLAAPRPRVSAVAIIVGLMLLVLAAKLAWCGHAGLVAAGFALLVAMAMSSVGRVPYLLDMALYALQTPVAGGVGLTDYARSADRLPRGDSPRGGWLSFLLPLIALIVFGALFILANPELATSFRDTMRQAADAVADWFRHYSPSWGEVFFWIVAAWLTIGLLRPVVDGSVIWSKSEEDRDESSAESPLYAAFRNMLLTVIALFAVYLVFEFKTLWFRTFPKGFCMPDMRSGAAWLSVALALATLSLSLVFRGRVLNDPRLPRLRKLAWLWSAENLILALAVYNRLFIYIGFNGMTRMRTLGLFGITAVVVGFILVVWKIVQNRDFVWLLQRHLWTLAIALYLLAITPVDPIVHTYNVRRVLAGDPAPVVQVSVHPISSEGVLVLQPLTHSRDQIIREGIRAMLADRAERLESLVHRPQRDGWTAFQLVDQVLFEKLQAVKSDWEPYIDRKKRQAALDRFHAYAYQWY